MEELIKTYKEKRLVFDEKTGEWKVIEQTVIKADTNGAGFVLVDYSPDLTHAIVELLPFNRERAEKKIIEHLTLEDVAKKRNEWRKLRSQSSQTSA